jgi:hypothetical protein
MLRTLLHQKLNPPKRRTNARGAEKTTKGKQGNMYLTDGQPFLTSFIQHRQ